MLFEGDFEETRLAYELKVPPECVVKTETFLQGDFLKKVFEASEIIRVYLKPPSATLPSEKPMLVNAGITVGELASRIHGGLYESLKYARLWRGGFKSTPLRVSPSFKLMDKDVVELRTR